MRVTNLKFYTKQTLNCDESKCVLLKHNLPISLVCFFTCPCFRLIIYFYYIISEYILVVLHHQTVNLHVYLLLNNEFLS